MKKPLETIKRLIQILSKKDKDLCNKYLDKRDFQSILEIVESNIYKIKKDEFDIPDNDLKSLLELQDSLTTYISYIKDSEEYNSYDNY